MKKLLAIMLVLAGLLSILFACGKAEPTEQQTAANEITTSETNAEQLDPFFEPPDWESRFFQSTGFTKLIQSNPLDLAEYRLNDGTNFRIYEQFAEHWQIELDYVLEKLYACLSDESVLALKKEQKLWEEYVTSSISLNETIFIESNETRELEPFDSVILDMTRRYEIRRRALELMEYCYRFSGKVEFIFETE